VLIARIIPKIGCGRKSRPKIEVRLSLTLEAIKKKINKRESVIRREEKAKNKRREEGK
jgi:hypothetical protein